MRQLFRKYDIELFFGGDKFKIRKLKFWQVRWDDQIFTFWRQMLLINVPSEGQETIIDYFHDIDSFFEKNEKTDHYSRYIITEDRYALFLLRFSL